MKYKATKYTAKIQSGVLLAIFVIGGLENGWNHVFQPHIVFTCIIIVAFFFLLGSFDYIIVQSKSVLASGLYFNKIIGRCNPILYTQLYKIDRQAARKIKELGTNIVFYYYDKNNKVNHQAILEGPYNGQVFKDMLIDVKKHAPHVIMHTHYMDLIEDRITPKEFEKLLLDNALSFTTKIKIRK